MIKKISNYTKEMNKFQGEQFRYKDGVLKLNISIHLSQLNYKRSLTCSALSQSQIYKDSSLLNAFNIIQSEKKILQCILEQANENYAVWLCDQGIWKLIILDPQIPSDAKQKNPSTIVTDHEWPILLEKAIVKLLDPEAGYNVLNQLLNYSIEPILFMLTGQQAEMAVINSFKDLQSQMGKQILFFVWKLKKSDQICYSIVDTKIQGSQELVVLRATCQEQILKEARQTNGTEFHLEWKDFVNNFLQIYQIKWVQEHKHQAFKLEQPTERKMKSLIEFTYVYTFTIDKETAISALLCQRDQNLNLKTQKKQEKYALCRLAFFKRDGDSYRFIGGKLDNQQNIQISLQLKKGEEYILFCQAYFRFDQIAFMAEGLSLLNIQFQGEAVPNEIKLVKQINQSQLLLSMIHQYVSQKNTRTYAALGQPKAQVTTQVHLGLLIFYYFNLGTASIHEQVDFEESENLLNYVTLKPDNSFKVEVNPLSRDEMVVYCFNPEILTNKNGFQFKYKLQITSGLSLSNSQRPSNPQEQSMKESDQAVMNLTEYIKTKGRRSQFNSPEINLYVLQHNAGVILLFENLSDKILLYQAEIVVSNLYMNCAKELFIDNQLKFDLQPKKNQFIYMDVINNEKAYEYRIQNQYSLASDRY